MASSPSYDTIVIGAGAAGMMCAAFAGGNTLVIDHARAAGEKIRISGGGRCNFTNMHTAPENFLSQNPHFCKSALKRYTQWDFLALVERHGIAWHEKTLGQLFCDVSARQIIAMLREEMARAGASLSLETAVTGVEKTAEGFRLAVEGAMSGTLACRNLVIATGGLSIPKMGASDFGYRIARQFGLEIVPTRAGLVPFLLDGEEKTVFDGLAGVSLPARVSVKGAKGAGGASFDEAVLFTHKGLSGPAALQASSYWREGEAVTVSFDPQTDFYGALRRAREETPKREIATLLSEILPKRFARSVAAALSLSGNIADHSDARLEAIADRLHGWEIVPSGTEGYRTAEVTVGGVSTDGLSSRTMEAKDVPGLFFIGEVVDVTGWLGGYNFQWAWSSGWAAGTTIAERRG